MNPIEHYTIITDCDGILTTPYSGIGRDGYVHKNFSVNDSLVIKKLLPYVQSLGRHSFDLVCYSGGGGSSIEITRPRVEGYLGIPVIPCANVDKFREISTYYNPESTVYFGDDIFDVPTLEWARFSATTADAPQVVKDAAKYISPHGGGHGIFTDAVFAFLKTLGYEPRDLILQMTQRS